MNIEDYIASGILEEFVFGTLSDQEKKEVLNLAAEYPKIKTEIALIEQSLETYVTAFSQIPPASNKTKIIEKIEQTVGFQLTPPVLTSQSNLEEYAYWLNKIKAPIFEEMHMEVIAEMESETMVIAWVKSGETDHLHNEYTERFLIAEGSCSAIIGGIRGNYSVGDYIEFPKNIEHSYIVTSRTPMKVVACLQY